MTDARHGTGLGQALVSTVPPTDAVATNQEGLYAIAAAQTFGKIALRAEQKGFRQVATVCVPLTQGANSLGDVAMIRETATPTACDPACGSGDTCLEGRCVTQCKPACGCGETCNAAGQCESSGAASPCGENATWLGGELCTCEDGFVPSGDGKSCTAPGAQTPCPSGAVATLVGCECQDGLIPNATGDACVLPEQAIATPVAKAKVLRTWKTPGTNPWGITSDGRRFWSLDRQTKLLYELELVASEKEAKVVSTVDLGDRAAAISDLAVVGSKLVLTTLPGGNATRPVHVLDLVTRALVDLAPTDYYGSTGTVSDGEALLLVEYGFDVQRRELSGALGPPAKASWAFGWAPANPTIASGPRAWVVDWAVSNRPPPFLALRNGAALTLRGTRYDGANFYADFLYNRAYEKGSILVPIPGSHVLGLAYDRSAWLVVGGSGLDHPVIAEVQID